MNLQRMEYFLVVAECLNFSKAAEQLFVSRQALSKQIHLLENEVGARLLEIDSTKVRLTEVGRKVVELYKPLSASVRQCEEDIRTFVEHKKTCIRVGYFSALPYRKAVAPVIRFLTESIPDAKVDLISADLAEIKKALNLDQIDLLIHIVHQGTQWSGVTTTSLCTLQEQIIVSELHPWYHKERVTAEDIRQERLICYEGSGSMDKRDFMGNMEVLERLYVPNTSTYMGVLASGSAFGVVSSLHNQSEGINKLLSLPPEYSSEANLAVSYKPLHPRADVFKKTDTISFSF